MFINSQFTLDYDCQMTDKYFAEYTGIDVTQFRETLLQHMSNVKKSVTERTRHQRQYERRVDKIHMQTQESKIDTGKAVDADLVVMESNGIESKVQDDNNRSGNDTDADDADVRPIYDKEPMTECHALADLSASINLMPLSVWKELSLLELTPTCMTLELADHSVSKPIGIAKDVKVKVGMFHFPANFVVVDFEPDPRVLLILGRCFLKTGRALIDVHKGELTLRIENEAITYNLDQTSRYSANYDQMTANKINQLGDIQMLEAILNSDPAPSPQTMNNLCLRSQTNSRLVKLKRSNLLLTNLLSPVHCVPKKGGFTVVKNEENELVPTRLVTGNEYYCFLDGFSGYFQIPIDPRDQEKTTFTCPYGTYAYRRMPFGLCNAPGIFQRCMLAIFHDMVEKTMEVFMDDFSVFGNSFKTCLSRLDKMLQSFSGYFQIPIDPKDQVKTTFTCPYGTFTYRRVTFGLCNAPGTFQRCMMAIFHDMIEKTMEVFMEDFLVFGNSFQSCLPFRKDVEEV
nr:reverse transcriptase domain-containing protein [Tanacetum cinerariifolium]